ncbi:MAG: hypothetical protein ACRD1V_11250 [Vicinamibacterales bacterium]
MCRADFAASVRHEKKGTLHYFTFDGNDTRTDHPPIRLHSDQATVVIDTR